MFLECPQNRYGEACMHTCNCQRKRDDTTGHCEKCKSGWIGEFCDMRELRFVCLIFILLFST